MFKEKFLIYYQEGSPEKRDNVKTKVQYPLERTQLFGEILKTNKGKLDQSSIEKSIAYINEELKHKDSISVRKNATLNVLVIQSLLAQAGYDPGELDDSWGGNTAKALKDFKRGEGVNEKGFGILTLNAFKKKFNVQEPIKKIEDAKQKIYENKNLDELRLDVEHKKDYFVSHKLKLNPARIEQGFYFDKEGILRNKNNPKAKYTILTDGKTIVLELPN